VSPLYWTPAATKPDADITVLCWRDDAEVCEWFAGWWDDEAGCWFDAASGGTANGVTHWADVSGPRPDHDDFRQSPHQDEEDAAYLAEQSR
jgi:hypothetical protein